MDYKVKYMNLCITNRCNLACVMCDIWREKNKIDLSPDKVEALLDSHCFDKDMDITLTGGEVFLHPEMFRIVDVILYKNSKWLKGISTNASRSKDMGTFLFKFGETLSDDFSFHVSLDGINTHDRQRGKSIARIYETIKVIQSYHRRIKIKIKFTITETNYTDIIPTYEFCQRNGFDFRVKLAEYAPNYTNRLDEQNFKFDHTMRMAVIKDLLVIREQKLKERDPNYHFITDSIELLQGLPKKKQCLAAFQRLFIMQNGDVFTCLHLPKIGNLNQNQLDELWNLEELEAIRNNVLDEGCPCGVSYHSLVPAAHS